MHVPELPPDPIFGLQGEFNEDQRAHKVNLSIGAYQNDAGKPEVFEAVRSAEKILLESHLDKEYLPIDGLKSFKDRTTELIFGHVPENTYTVQTVGGTGALRLGGDLLKTQVTKQIFLSNPTWVNHHNIFEQAGLTIGEYPYYDPKSRSLDFEGMVKSIKAMPAGSAILLHACCHNPSGIDPTIEQWKELSRVIKEQKLLPFFDLAYQGFGRGLDEDAFAVREFFKDGHEMLVAYSYSKNFGLYGERVGMLVFVSHEKETLKKIGSVVKKGIRALYSNPPLQGARIISTILEDEELKSLWAKELKAIRGRIQSMRHQLATALSFDHLKDQQGMFSYSGLNSDHVERLKEEYGIYMLKSGRINVAGLNEKNMKIVIDAILDVVKR